MNSNFAPRGIEEKKSIIYLSLNIDAISLVLFP